MSKPGDNDHDRKADGAAGDLGDSDDETPRAPPGRPASDAALRLAYAAAILVEVARVLGDHAGGIDDLAPDKRRLFVRRTFEGCRTTIRGLSALLDDIEAAEAER